MDKEELLRTITSAYDELAELVERISDDRLLDPAMDDWTGKDVLAHLAWWQDHSARLAEDFRAGRQPDDTTHPGSTTDEINEYVFRKHVDDSPEVARVEFKKSFERLLLAIEPLTDKELFSPGLCSWLDGVALSEMLFWDSSRHYQQHFVDLEPLSPRP
ncbi:MAG: ClbS/DfsB family four-helix bundle protein [Acidimicrobiales bacterium]